MPIPYEVRLVAISKMTAVFKVSFKGLSDDVGEGSVIVCGCLFDSVGDGFWDTSMDSN